MPTNPITQSVFRFLGELKLNNNKPWFEQHRPEYESARSSFELFVSDILDEFRDSDDLQGITAKNCIARIYRDIRFSKDKSPYKTNLSAMIAPVGWKTSWRGYYISIEPDDRSLLAGGLYDPTPDQLNQFRQTIERDATAFKRLTSAREFVEFFGTLEGERLKTAPKGFDREHPEIGLLQLKQITVMHHFTDQEVLAGDFTEQVLKGCRVMKPFLDYLSSIIQ